MTVHGLTANYYIGTGIVSWTPSGGTKRDLGNCIGLAYSPTIETKEHKSFRGGAPTVDLESVASQKYNIEITLDEITAENLALFLFGEESTNSDGGLGFAIGAVTTKIGALEMVGANDQGKKFLHNLTSVQLTPSGTWQAIGEEYGNIVLRGTISAGRIDEIVA